VSGAPAPRAGADTAGLVSLLRSRAGALLFLAWLLASVGLVYWGLFSQPFFVSRACTRLLLFPAIGYGLAIATAWALAMRGPAPPGLAQRLLQLGLVPLLFALIGFESLSAFLPSALNALAGHAYSRGYTVAEVVQDSGGERCNHITVRELDPAALFLPICVSQSTVDTLKPGATLWLNGRESWFGLSVSSYSLGGPR
jgi:hypothetical protein